MEFESINILAVNQAAWPLPPIRAAEPNPKAPRTTNSGVGRRFVTAAMVGRRESALRAGPDADLALCVRSALRGGSVRTIEAAGSVRTIEATGSVRTIEATGSVRTIEATGSVLGWGRFTFDFEQSRREGGALAAKQEAASSGSLAPTE